MASCGGVGCEREESRRIHIDPAVEHLICVDHVSTSPSVVEGRQLQGPQSLVVRQVMNGGYHAGRPALDPFHQLLICPVKRAPHQVPVLQPTTYCNNSIRK